MGGLGIFERLFNSNVQGDYTAGRRDKDNVEGNKINPVRYFKTLLQVIY